MSGQEVENRIDELESRLEFQEDTIASLNKALVGQQQRMDQLEESLTLVIARFDEKPESNEGRQEPPPPHY